MFLVAARNLPPDAVQSHKHTLHVRECQISSESETVMHSGRLTKCVRKNPSIERGTVKKKNNVKRE